MESGKPICFVTGNSSKLLEFTDIVGDKLNIISKDLEVPPEIQGTCEEIIAEKAKSAAELYGGPVLVDDTAFFINALGGAPGPYIKDFLFCMKPVDIWKVATSQGELGATAVCTIGFCEPGKDPVAFRGECCGHIVEPKGTGGFGFDCIFAPSAEYGGNGQTYAEMSRHIKDKISHRARAVKASVEYLTSRTEQI